MSQSIPDGDWTIQQLLNTYECRYNDTLSCYPHIEDKFIIIRKIEDMGGIADDYRFERHIFRESFTFEPIDLNQIIDNFSDCMDLINYLQTQCADILNFLHDLLEEDMYLCQYMESISERVLGYKIDDPDKMETFLNQI